MTTRHDERGDTLIEVLIAIVIIGIVAIGSFFAISMGATNSKAQRDFVTADAVLRNYAETVKQTVRVNCNGQPAGTAYTVSYVPPSGFLVTAKDPSHPLGLTCPSAATVNEVDIEVTVPDGTKKRLNIDVRTP
jgi:prepilin-type N-terminal cleavage/methylation domain-containing protein